MNTDKTPAWILAAIVPRCDLQEKLLDVRCPHCKKMNRISVRNISFKCECRKRTCYEKVEKKQWLI